MPSAVMTAVSGQSEDDDEVFMDVEGDADDIIDVWQDVAEEDVDDDEAFFDPETRTSHFAHFRQNDSINCTLVNRSRLCNEMACYIITTTAV